MQVYLGMMTHSEDPARAVNMFVLIEVGQGLWCDKMTKTAPINSSSHLLL